MVRWMSAKGGSWASDVVVDVSSFCEMRSVSPEGWVFNKLGPENGFGVVFVRQALDDVKLYAVIPSNHENVCDDDAWDDACETVVYFDRVVRDVELRG